MGSYSEFGIGNRAMFSTKHGFDPLLMTLFRPSDKLVMPASEFFSEGDDELTDGVSVVVQYRSTAGALRDRLNAMGFSLQFCRRQFDEGINSRIQDPETHQTSTDVTGADRAIPESLTFDVWLTGFCQIIKKDLEFIFASDPPRDDLQFPISWMLRQYDRYGFPPTDIRVFLRAAVEAFPPEAVVIHDLTDLVYGGYYASEDDLIEYADYLITANFVTTQKVIVLTEGASDQRALAVAFRVLKPALVDYYSFMDFDAINVPGGAGMLVGFVKAFAASGVINRVVGLFDNDTAAESALRGLNRSTLPANIRVLQYPTLPFAKCYPTLGPTGISPTDVNGLACSLELYFGRDILEKEDGLLTPVQWRGYDPYLRKYQGEIMDKKALQNRFIRKAETCLSDPSARSLFDWSGMELVLDHLVSAFHDVDPPLHPPQLSYEY